MWGTSGVGCCPVYKGLLGNLSILGNKSCSVRIVLSATFDVSALQNCQTDVFAYQATESNFVLLYEPLGLRLCFFFCDDDSSFLVRDSTRGDGVRGVSSEVRRENRGENGEPTTGPSKSRK